jgi:mono/diheme cytochrome c family protein
MLIASFVVSGALATLHGQNVPTINRVPPVPTSPGDGKEMFIAYCAACHGADATGKGPAAPALKKAPADLTTLAARNNGVFPQLHVSRFIKGDEVVEAHGSRDMPIWGMVFDSMHPHQDSLVLMRIANLTAYIQGVQKK